MKLLIGEAEYDLDGAVEDLSLAFVARMNRVCGFGPRTLTERLNRLSGLKNPSDVIEDLDLLDAICALVWIVRVRAGEDLTLEQATAVSMEHITLRGDDDDAAGGGEPDPTRARTVSVPGAAPRASRPPRRGRSTTSARTSGRG